MNDTDAVRALAALANPHRLAVFRALVRAGDEGLSAGELAAVAGIAASALTFHSKELERAGLIATRREGRFMRSALNVPVMRGLISFLADDCCGGRPDLCGVSSLPRDLLSAGEACCPDPLKTKKVTI